MQKAISLHKFNQIIQSWADALMLSHAYLSVQNYSRALMAYIDFVSSGNDFAHDDGDIVLDEVFSKDNIERYFAYRREKNPPLSLSSAKTHLAGIRHFIATQVRLGHMQKDTTAQFKLARHSRPLPYIAEAELLGHLLDTPPLQKSQACLWVRDRAIFELLYGAGVRVGELVGLNIQDVDMQERLVRVLGKGNKMRVVPFTDSAQMALQAYLDTRTPYAPSEALFMSEQTQARLSIRSVQKRLKAVALRAGIDLNLYPHLLRHCFASHMLSASGDLRAVQELLGHSSLATTQIYTHLDFDALAKVYDRAHPRAKIGKDHQEDTKQEDIKGDAK